ncbi:hypothetical protein DKX38_015580 [Salix brachista]|uniref:Uncharacterized protein n=1 Tax=Salix brachista TaxID=2182728 RepID=A0A5N5L5L1_9ROSI|nr:hypothetical protein DKX38_015580 [Salix brachista]
MFPDYLRLRKSLRKIRDVVPGIKGNDEPILSLPDLMVGITSHIDPGKRRSYCWEIVFMNQKFSIVISFNPSKRDCLYGPFPEITSRGKPSIYRQFIIINYIPRFFTKELDGNYLKVYYKQ